MAEQPPDFLDLAHLWEALLSRQADKVKAVFNSLDEASQTAVYSHLQRMVSESDWHPEQRLSAQAAMNVLNQET